MVSKVVKDLILAGVGVGLGILGIKVLRAKTPQPQPPQPPTPVVTVTIDSDPRGVPVTVVYPSGSGSTPMSVTVEKGKVVTFTVPKEFNGLVFSDVDNASVVSTNSHVELKAVADADKTVMLHYAKPTPSTPKWVFDQGNYGVIKVYDVWYNPNANELGVDVEVVCGETGRDTDIVGAMLSMNDSETHGFLMGSVGCGRKVVTATPKYTWWFDYGVVVNARYRYGGLTPAITIPKSEIRVVTR